MKRGTKEELRNRLLGTWQLVNSVIRFDDGEFRDQLGKEPSGFLTGSFKGVNKRSAKRALKSQTVPPALSATATSGTC
jgi:hypothetical protein